MFTSRKPSGRNSSRYDLQSENALDGCQTPTSAAKRFKRFRSRHHNVSLVRHSEQTSVDQQSEQGIR
jgi:hypothetical protein